MVFSAFLGSSGERTAKTRSLKASASVNSLATQDSSDEKAQIPDHINDESQLQPTDVDPPDLRELNAGLAALAAVFPDVQIDVLREMLVNFDGESRLALVADALLKNRATWVKGRWRVAGKLPTEDLRGESLKEPMGAIPRRDAFRSPEYKQAALTLALHEFKGLSKATIKAVLAEANHSYLDARQTLVDLSSKSWRFTISSVILRRKPVTFSDAENHPLIIWKSSGVGSIVPCLKSTGHAELDRELYLALIKPIRDDFRLAQQRNDHALAMELNTKEAEEADSTHECTCCFTTATFEEFVSCGTSGHLVCFRCVQHSVNEAIFGQGWHRTIDKVTGTLRCPAVDSKECEGHIPSYHMYRAMLEDSRGADILYRLEQRIAEHALMASNAPLVRCPFCPYAEIDEILVRPSEGRWRLRIDTVYGIAVALCLSVVVFPILFTAVLVSMFVCICSGIAFLMGMQSTRFLWAQNFVAQISGALLRHQRRRRGLRFICQSPECGRASCLSCQKAWVDVHVCHESELVALRTQVEQAMSMAIKRVCPRCNTSFVKTAGCNKLTCPCGYKMCYVCRKDIGGNGDGPDVGYRHFCEHFRPTGDPTPCKQCSKCNLWESEDTDKVLQQAKQEAERKWREKEKLQLSGAEKAFLETGVAAQQSRGSEIGLQWGQWPTLAQFLDFVIIHTFA